MLRAVLFDWSNTLARWELGEAMLAAGHRAGLAELGPDAPGDDAFTAAFIARTLPGLVARSDDEVDYSAALEELLAALGRPAERGAIDRFIAAEYEAWKSAHALAPSTLWLLDAVRARGLKTGLVANLFDPPDLVRDMLAELGLLERLDVVALSGEVGKRKPHPALFQRALDDLGLEPEAVVMVGDSLRDDVGGAQAIGMRSIHAVWLVTEGRGSGAPDGVAETPAEVVELIDGWLAAP